MGENSDQLPKELSRFCKAVTENIATYSDLVDFAVKCDAPITWIDRAKEDNPNDTQSAINQVFYEWWDRSHLNLARKLKMIQQLLVTWASLPFLTE